MGRRTATLALAGALLAVGAPAGPAAASGEAPKADPAVEALLARLERPPEARSVMGVVRMPAVARDPATALRVVCVLWHAGGYASAAGLRVLARHDDACVRATAIRGVAHVGLRVRAGFDAVREALKDSACDVRDAAFEAVGRAGDAGDVPALLEAMRSEECPRRHAAFRALTALTGQLIPCDVSRWAAWWGEAEGEMPRRLAAALDMLASDAKDADFDSARSTVQRFGWMAVDDVSRAVQGWLRSTDARLRGEGYRLAASLRLGDLADEVSGAFRYERHPDAWAPGRDAALALGTPTEGVKAPDAFVPDRRIGR